jgi:hypothetical protein
MLGFRELALKRLWLLHLVPAWRFGRWWCALAVFSAMVVLLASAGMFSTGDVEGFDGYIALFFCVIVAYIVPIFHFVTGRTQGAFDALVALMPYSTVETEKLRQAISSKSLLWMVINLGLATALWMGQSWILSGSTTRMMYSLTASYASFVSAVAPLVVWLTMTCAIHALVDNARLFRRLAKQVNLRLLDTRALTPFGTMAVSSTLVVIGSQASFSIMWLGDSTSVWTTIPGIVPITLAMVFLFLAPIWPIHKSIKELKQLELDRVQEHINTVREQAPQDYVQLNPALVYRREVMAVPEWPFDLGLVTRLGLYLVIVPLTWIGAALIEKVVDLMV